MINIEVQKAPDTFWELKTDLDRLYTARQHEPSTSFEWTEALKSHHLRSENEYLMLTGRKNNQLNLFIPFVFEKVRVGRIFLVNLRILCERYNTHSDLLCERLDEITMELMIQGCKKIKSRWDIMRFTRVLEGADFDRALKKALPKLGARFRTQFEPPSFFLKLPRSYKNYLKDRSSKFRSYLKRMEKRLSAMDGVDFIKICSKEEFNDAYNSLLSIEQTSWKHKHGTAISAVEHQKTFYRELSREALNAGRLHLTFLLLGKIPVAYNLGLISNGRYYYLKTSFNEEYRRYGVATVCRARMIRMIIEEGVKEFDFPGEPYEWEKQWAKELRWHRSYTIYNDTFTGCVFYFLDELRSLIKKRSKEKELIYYDPLKIRTIR